MSALAVIRVPGPRMEARTVRRAEAAERRKGPVVYELFSGAGFLSYAFLAEGFRVHLAIENDPTAAETYRSQIGEHILVKDIRTVRPEGRCDVLVAAPPCQPFSTLGARRPDDERRALTLEVARWARAVRPRVVVVENVAAFAGSVEHETLVARLRRLGFETQTLLLDSFDFGVAQRRLRSFTLAWTGQAPVVRTPGRVRFATVADALDGLSLKPDGENSHYAPTPGGLALARMKLVPEGGDKRDIMRRNPRLVPPSWRAMGVEVTDAWGRLRWDQPANTIRTCFNNASKGRYMHPEEHRVISLREAARLQSIPDSFGFTGTAWNIARHIGNGVPPAVGRAVARAILATL